MTTAATLLAMQVNQRQNFVETLFARRGRDSTLKKGSETVRRTSGRTPVKAPQHEATSSFSASRRQRLVPWLRMAEPCHSATATCQARGTVCSNDWFTKKLTYPSLPRSKVLVFNLLQGNPPENMRRKPCGLVQDSFRRGFRRETASHLKEI